MNCVYKFSREEQVKMIPQDQELKELLLSVRQALLGITLKITEALQKVPEQLDKITHQIYEFNKLMLDTQMKLTMMGVDKDNPILKPQKELFERARDVIEGNVYNYLNANQDNKLAYKQKALNELIGEKEKGKEGINTALRTSMENKSNAPKLK
ncbi:MAG: hypothetical protein A3F42_07060 [Gammaproteobacteria bacterium RIFCSPHIGHO2_12_FULL_37_34]|nr:MAG: hypothetical protein A3F42_07060 [Gammaproteobacteria bacterium RIFCSPHIGHO2_12_FULL_37_34]